MQHLKEYDQIVRLTKSVSSRTFSKYSVKYANLLDRKVKYSICIPESVKRDLDLYEVVLIKTSFGFLIKRAGLDNNIRSMKNRTCLGVPAKMVDEEQDLGEYELQVIDEDTIELIKI